MYQTWTVMVYGSILRGELGLLALLIKVCYSGNYGLHQCC